MPLHKDLTGAELHEPKGVESANEGTVYVADGAGSGSWQPKLEGLINANLITLTGTIDDISNPSAHYRFVAPVKCELVSLVAILDNAITLADSTLTVLVNGVPFADTLVVPYATSTAGASSSRSFTTPSTINAGTAIEVRSDGNSTTTARTFLQLTLRAKS